MRGRCRRNKRLKMAWYCCNSRPPTTADSGHGMGACSMTPSSAATEAALVAMLASLHSSRDASAGCLAADICIHTATTSSHLQLHTMGLGSIGVTKRLLKIYKISECRACLQVLWCSQGVQAWEVESGS